MRPSISVSILCIVGKVRLLKHLSRIIHEENHDPDAHEMNTACFSKNEDVA